MNASDRIENIIIDAAQNKSHVLYDALKSKRINTIVTRLLQGGNASERVDKYLLKEMIAARTKSASINPNPDKQKVDSLLTTAMLLAKREIDELGVFSSNKLKLAKVDFLTDFILLLNTHKQESLTEGKEAIKRDLSAMVLDHLGEANFKNVMKGKRVRELVLKATGALSVEALISELKLIHSEKHALNAGPIASMSNYMNTMHLLITQNQLEQANTLLTDLQEDFLRLGTIAASPNYAIDQRASCAKLCETYSAYAQLIADSFSVTKRDDSYLVQSHQHRQQRISYRDQSKQLENQIRDTDSLRVVQKIFDRCDNNVNDAIRANAEIRQSQSPSANVEMRENQTLSRSRK